MVVPARRPSWRERLSSWLNEAPPAPETEVLFEFSVGKYTFTRELSKSWEFVRIPADEFLRAAETQKVTPVLLMRNGWGKRWWWYLGRFYREAVGLTPGEVHEHVLRMLRAQEDEERRLLYLEREAARQAEERAPVLAAQATNSRPPAEEATNGRAAAPALEEDLQPSLRARTEAPASAGVR